jgi:hypothetical protein
MFVFKIALTGFLLAVLVVPPATHAQTTYLEADFDDKPIDMPIGTGGPTVGEPVYVAPFIDAVVRDTPLPTPCLEISDIDDYYAGSANFYFLDDAELTTGHLTMTCTLWFNYDETGEGYSVMFRENGSAAFNFLTLRFAGNGEVSCYDTNSYSPILATYEPGRPVPLTVSFDLDAGTYTIWLDGVGIRWNDSHGIVGSGVGSLLIGCTNDLNTEGTFYIDDILITDQTVVSGVDDGDLAAAAILNPCYPNPFNPLTTISLELARSEPVQLQILDVTGRRVKTLHDGPLVAGSHAFRWDGRNDRGEDVASGCYLSRLAGKGWSDSQTMVLVR